MAKVEKTEKKNQAEEKSPKKVIKSSYSKKKENEKKYSKWYCLRTIYF